jgi:hypothetical protein
LTFDEIRSSRYLSSHLISSSCHKFIFICERRLVQMEIRSLTKNSSRLLEVRALKPHKALKGNIIFKLH